jgi:MtfA peptidase
MVLAALRNWRRDRVLKRAQLDDQLWRGTVAQIPFLRVLSAAEAARLRDLSVLFLHEKHFSAAAGLQLSEPMRLFVAAQACVLILELGLEYYRGWSEIVVYPAQFVPRHQHVDEFGVVHQGEQPYAGEAWLRGPVVLSWEDVEGSHWPDGANVVIHEFAHKLDMLNGAANGYPPLHRGMRRETWSQAFGAAYQDFCTRVDRSEYTRIDPYASESPGEFFAVLSEVFFETPAVVRLEYPAVYEQLLQFYRQDPIRRMEGAA